jgi:hypothetical protein
MFSAWRRRRRKRRRRRRKRRRRKRKKKKVADSPGFQTPRQGNTFLASPKRPNRLWEPPSLLLNRYRVPFLGVERQGHLLPKTGVQYAQYL